LLGTFDSAQGPVDQHRISITSYSVRILIWRPTFDDFAIDSLSFGVTALPEPSTRGLMILSSAVSACWHMDRKNKMALNAA
jgi:hypothetical protein